MDGHDLDRVPSLGAGRLLVLARKEDEVEVAHERVERSIERCLTELGHVLRESADVGHRLWHLYEIPRLLHQLEEEVAHVDLGGGRSESLEQGLHGAGGRARQGDAVGWIADHAQHRDQVSDLGQVVESMTADDDVRHAFRCQRARDRTRDGVGTAQHRDGRRRRAGADQAGGLPRDRGRLRRGVVGCPQPHSGSAPG